ncbi:DUF58 domain-containing protein [Vibrio methylphosphonaticus]|uniref:DUF58 domain-containing protein n=1 Tax=Vibrio methylphosphonaticus TaxID=2946866 RepID=UPI00202A85E4|nr:DUF58 domain-containing protein [Vibrio methylphosphonaticus]MCL9773828.1 DUF58 domain-containing protein [Vibrio methylphosphonaticus]
MFFQRRSNQVSPLQQAIEQGNLPTCNGVSLTVDELAFYQTHGKRWQPPAKSLWSQLNGAHLSPHKGRGMTFSEVRQYQAGDDVRQIDWRVTARTGKVHTKLFSEERERPVVLFLDLTPSLFSGTKLLLKSVQLCHLASLLCWVAVANKDRVGAVIRTQDRLIELRPSSSKGAVYQLLNTIVSTHNRQLEPNMSAKAEQAPAFAPQEQSDVKTQAFDALSNLCRKGSEVVLISDFSTTTAHDFDTVKRLSQHNRVRAIQLYDPLDIAECNSKGLQRVRGKINDMTLDMSSARTRAAIKQAYLDHHSRIQYELASFGIHLSQISTGAPLLQQILERQS